MEIITLNIRRSLPISYAFTALLDVQISLCSLMSFQISMKTICNFKMNFTFLEIQYSPWQTECKYQVFLEHSGHFFFAPTRNISNTYLWALVRRVHHPIKLQTCKSCIFFWWFIWSPNGTYWFVAPNKSSPEKANITFRPINKIDLDTLHIDLSNSDPETSLLELTGQFSETLSSTNMHQNKQRWHNPALLHHGCP